MSRDYRNSQSGGGYYDEYGNYIDENGGYYDENGYYYDANGGYYDEMGNYFDGNGGYYDPDGNYYLLEDETYDDLQYEDVDNMDPYRDYNNGYSHRNDGRGTKKQPKKVGKKIGLIVSRVLLVLLTFILTTVIGLYLTIYIICKGPSEASKNLFVSTIQETGQLKFVNKLFFSEEEIVAITNVNSMGRLEADVDTGLITVGGGDSEDGESASADFDINGFELVEITGRTYFAKMFIVNDPSRVKLTTLYNNGWPDYGQTLDVHVNSGNYLAGMNGGEYESDSNRGGHPKGIVVCDGQIQYNNPQNGDVMVGFNKDDILIIRDIGGKSSSDVAKMVEELEIRDAVSFKDVNDGDDNHFTKVIINGEALELKGNGSGANPRTVIGQTADGTVLMLVTDGRGAGGHLGATAADIISIMQEYGAVNAANLDGGSSSCMYYDGEYEMTSVTLYYSNASWNLPLAFVVERRD